MEGNGRMNQEKIPMYSRDRVWFQGKKGEAGTSGKTGVAVEADWDQRGISCGNGWVCVGFKNLCRSSGYTDETGRLPLRPKEGRDQGLHIKNERQTGAAVQISGGLFSVFGGFG